MDEFQILKIRLNLLDFLCTLHVTNQIIVMLKRQNRWILVIDSYLTLSHENLLRRMKLHNSSVEERNKRVKESKEQKGEEYIQSDLVK